MKKTDISIECLSGNQREIHNIVDKVHREIIEKIYHYLFRKENIETEEFQEYGVVHIFEDDFKAFIEEEFDIDITE